MLYVEDNPASMRLVEQIVARRPDIRLLTAVNGTLGIEVARTTQPAVQLFTANHLGHRAVCLETQHYPDAVHHPNFPSIVMRPDAPFQETTTFTFLTDHAK